MAIQTLYDTGADYDIPSKYDGAVYSLATNDCVIQGIGDEFTLTTHENSREVTFSAGSQAVIGGGFFRTTSSESITLQANTTVYLCANIDLSKPNGMTGSFVQRTSSNMQSDNLNGGGTSRDLLLYVITTNANGITNVVDRRVRKSKATTSYNDLTDKPTIPTVNNATLTIQRNGSTVGTFTANSSANKTVNITVPTNTSQLTNDSGYLNASTGFFGIDSAKVYRDVGSSSPSGRTSKTWTATFNCLVWVFNPPYGATSIDGREIFSNASGHYIVQQPLPLKKGSTITVWCNGDSVSYDIGIVAYGVK